MNSHRAFLVALLTALASTAMMAADTGTLRIRVVDSEGAVMEEAQVIVRPDSTGRQHSGATTATVTGAAKAGRMTRELEPGFYDVCALADAFVPVCQKARVLPGATKTVSLRMKIDVNVIREVGDTFPTTRR